jgi:multisubunit Na+/H+ antiporter MnhB subunit
MKNYILIGIVTLLILAYLFLYLGIELELKYTIEGITTSNNQLINASFKIRKFITIQLILVFSMFTIIIYSIFRKNKPK